MPCKKSTLKKYTSRPSPPYPAQDCPKKRKKGSDGTWYVSTADKKGVYRWKKEPKTAKTTIKKMEGSRSYLVHDNGGRPYRVEIGDHRAIVYDNTSSSIVYQTPVERVWIGDNLLSVNGAIPKGTGRGNTILLQTAPHRYVYIGHVIYSFSTGNDSIQEYYSPIGNSDVPYPYAVGEKNVYFLLDKQRVAVEKMDLAQDGYKQFYQTVARGDKKTFGSQLIHTPS